MKSFKEFITEGDFNITDLLIVLRDRYMSEYNISVENLNDGLCETIASEVSEVIGEDHILNDTIFCTWNRTDESDIRTVNAWWSLIEMDKFNSIPSEEVFNKLTQFVLNDHYWIYYNNKHYDTEAVLGVNSFWELPIYKRQIEGLI